MIEKWREKELEKEEREGREIRETPCLVPAQTCGSRLKGP